MTISQTHSLKKGDKVRCKRNTTLNVWKEVRNPSITRNTPNLGDVLTIKQLGKDCPVDKLYSTYLEFVEYPKNLFNFQYFTKI